MENMLRSASPVCKYTGLSSAILSPSDDTITNYIVISGQIQLNPLQGKTGPRTTEDGKFSLEATRCIGACGLAPVFTVNEEVYGKATPELMKKVIEEYKNKE